MKRKNLIIVLIIVLLLATLGISVAVFSSLTNGNTNNTLAVGDLKFHYTEITGVGNGINLVDPLPITDNEGKVLNGEREYFEFSIESNTIKSDIEYEVVVEPTSKSTVSLEGIKFYLTEVVNNNEQEIEYSINENNKVKTLSEYNETEIENASGRTVYSETIANNTRNYYKKFRARIWLSEDIDWTDEGYIGKTGSFKINVYAKGKVTPKQLTLKETVLYESNGGYSLIELPDSSFTRVSNEQENGLFKSTKTNTGRTTYYFRGNVNNNWVSFAGKLWRIVRVNEDGTVRLIMQDGINDNQTYAFNSTNDTIDTTYYSNSTAKTTLDTWYTNNITNEGYNYYVAKGNYYCEQAKVRRNTTPEYMTIYSSYSVNYNCQTDSNNKGLLNTNIGMITYDEIIFAGGQPYCGNENCYNNSFYLNNGISSFTMSSAGYVNPEWHIWDFRTYGDIGYPQAASSRTLRPVINIKENVKVIDGTGTQNDPYIIGTTKVYESIDRVLASLSNDTGDVIICDGLKGKLSNCNKYNDLSTAIASRNKGTIILVNDTIVSQKITLGTGKEYVLELNGYKIESSTVNTESTTWADSHIIFYLNGGKLTSNDKIGTGGAYAGKDSRVFNVKTGSLTINSGDYNGRQVIVTTGNANVEINGGTFNSKYTTSVGANDGNIVINGGTFTSNVTTTGVITASSPGRITINNGTFTCNVASVVRNDSIMTINGGTFTGGAADAPTIYNRTGGNITITGGKIISNSYIGIRNDADATIKQTTNPLYIATIGTSANTNSVPIYNKGVFNIKASKANLCTNDPTDTTSGLCAYGAYRSGVIGRNPGKLTIDGGTYVSTFYTVVNRSAELNIKNASVVATSGNAIANSDSYVNVEENPELPGTITICSTTVSSTNYDIYEANTGTHITITNNNTFTNGTNIPTATRSDAYTTTSICPF